MFNRSIVDQMNSWRDLLASAKSEKEFYQKIVDTPFSNQLEAARMDLGIMVLLLVNELTGCIDRVALSKTEQAERTLKISMKPFSAIKIPVDDKENMVAEAIRKRKAQKVVDWKYLFTPDMPAEAARLNQASAGIECSIVQPLNFKSTKMRGALIFSFIQPISLLNRSHNRYCKHYAETVTDVYETNFMHV